MSDIGPCDVCGKPGRWAGLVIGCREHKIALKAAVKTVTAPNNRSLPCPLFESRKMCRVFNDKPLRCSGVPCDIIGPQQKEIKNHTARNEICPHHRYECCDDGDWRHTCIVEGKRREPSHSN